MKGGEKYNFFCRPVPLIVALVVLLQTSCTRRFDEINTDTGKLTADQYTAEYSLTRAQLEYTGNSDYSYETWRVNIIYCGMMMQQLANTSWYAGDKYIQHDGWSSAYFDVAFKDQVKYVVDLLKASQPHEELSNLYQAGRIMRVLVVHRLTDLYGDIPYTEAGLGYYGRIFTPRYDDQQSIYLNMLQELDEAAQLLDPAKPAPGNGDLIYRAAPDALPKWKKLAYSLMLRLGMRLVKVNEPLAKHWVEKAYAGGVMNAVGDNAYIKHSASGGRTTVNRNSNILGGEWNATGWDRSGNAKREVFLSKTLIDFLQTKHDPRLPWMAQLRGDGNTDPDRQQGLPNGYDQNGGLTDISKRPDYPGSLDGYSTIRGDVWLKLDAPTLLVSYAQCELLLAEAALRGWQVGESAATHYNNGVTAAMRQLSLYEPSAVIGDATIAEYLSENPFTGANGMEQINQQYWLCCFLDWYEAWANWRRTDYPQLVPVNYVGNATGGQIPRRMLYPSSEAAVNEANYLAAISRQGPNTFLTRVWWDKY